MTDEKPKPTKISAESTRAAGEAAYARAMLQHGAGNMEESMIALEQALSLGFPPAILTVGSIEYQRQQPAKGKEFFMSLIKLPRETENLFEIIEEAGAFLISINELTDAYELYQKAAKKFPDIGGFHQRAGQCAAQDGRFDEALAAANRAIKIEPDNSVYVSDLGWTLILAERYQEAETAFLRALEMDSANETAKANLEYCRDMMSEQSPPPEPAPPAKKAGKKKARRRS
jgi:Flp pilus assembly protein TadD